MAQSLSKVYVHIAFSTKNRFPFIDKRAFQQELLAFLKKYKIEYDERYLWD
jgi:hypothetical protein